MIHLREASSQQGLNEEQCWQSIVARQPEADGSFVFAVHSTGIYCRPSCPARRPHRQQVVFFHQPADAEGAGFRPCRRCHPQQQSLPEAHEALVEQVCHYIETHLDSPLHLADLGQQFSISPYHLQRTFKRVKGVTPRQYAEACRLEQFKARLHEGEAVTSALYNAGYQSSSSVYERTPMQLGMTPTAYSRRGKGRRMSYAVVESSLGFVLVATTERGVAAVRFGDDEASVVEDLVHEYPEAELVRDEEGLRSWVTLLLEHLHGRPTSAPIPLDVQASAFQWKVWEALRRIPVGQTRSYQEVAAEIGQPTATRAVAQACASNPVAVFVPCHRVVRADGQTGGYRWGSKRKQQLLAQEGASREPALLSTAKADRS